MQEQIVIKSDESIILTVPVMIPNTPDCDFQRGEKTFTVEEVKAFKELYDEYGFIDKHHAIQDVYSADKNELIGYALKSFLLPEDTPYKRFDGTVRNYPKGTWMATTEVTDPVTIQQVKEGLITGASPSIFPRAQAEQIKAALKASAGGLIKDISDPVPAIISLVRKPCQHGNKFCKTNIGENMSEDKKAQSKLNQIMNILGGKEPEYALKEDLEDMKEEITSAFKSDEFKGFLKDVVNECVTEALKEPSFKGEEPPKKEDNKTKGGDGEKPSEGGSSEEPPKEEDDKKGEGEKPATKEDSKQLPQHDGDKPALKSDKAIIMEMIGRTSKGRPKKE